MKKNRILSYKLFEMSIPYRKGDDEYNIITAIYNNDIKRLEDIASRIGLNWKGRDYTPLEYAAFTGRLDMVKKLIELGADINYGKVLYHAVSGNHSVITKYLIECGIDPNKGKYNEKPLYLANKQNNVEVFDALLVNGTDPNFNVETNDYNRNINIPFIFIVKNPITLRSLINNDNTNLKVLDNNKNSLFTKSYSWWDNYEIRKLIIEYRIDLLIFIKDELDAKSYKDLVLNSTDGKESTYIHSIMLPTYTKYEKDIKRLDTMDKIGLM